MARAVVHGFVAPALDGPPTGGTLYNARLIAALQRMGVECRHWELAALPADPAGHADVLWVDSLYMAALPELRVRARDGRVHLMLHYLPSFVKHGREVPRGELSTAERDALDGADALLVTSRGMRDALVQLGVNDRPVLCVEPGVDVPAGAGDSARPAHGEVAGLMLCSVVAGKGVLAMLHALAERAATADRFSLAIAGRLDAETAYAAACGELIASEPRLADRVRLLGALAHTRALAALRDADVLLSASRMEAYGMALAEARALGVPIVARRAGPAAAHVDAAAGGELVEDEADVAASFLALVRDTRLLRERRRSALAARRMRAWEQAAAEWIAQVGALGGT